MSRLGGLKTRRWPLIAASSRRRLVTILCRRCSGWNDFPQERGALVHGLAPYSRCWVARWRRPVRANRRSRTRAWCIASSGSVFSQCGARKRPRELQRWRCCGRAGIGGPLRRRRKIVAGCMTRCTVLYFVEHIRTGRFPERWSQSSATTLATLDRSSAGVPRAGQWRC